MQFEGGATVSFTMVAFTEKVCARQTKIFGTKVYTVCDSIGNSTVALYKLFLLYLFGDMKIFS